MIEQSDKDGFPFIFLLILYFYYENFGIHVSLIIFRIGGSDYMANK